MSRITRHQMFAEISRVIAKRATCSRLQVGAVITVNNRIVSTGYNGPLSVGSIPCKVFCDSSKPCTRSIHAEVNAIYAAAKAGIKLDGGVLYCTHAPCFNCANAIIQSGITQVSYIENYRDTSGVDLLIKAGVRIIQLDNEQI